MFLDHMEDNLKDLLNYYENFCNELVDLELSKEEQAAKEITIEMVDSNKDTGRKLNQLEIIEEKDSVPTSSDYSPVDRVETEPIYKKRESYSSLFGSR